MNIDPSISIHLNRGGYDPFQSSNQGSQLANPANNYALDPGDIDFNGNAASPQQNEELTSQLLKLVMALLASPQSSESDPGGSGNSGGSGGSGGEPPVSGNCGGGGGSSNIGKPNASGLDPNGGGEFNGGPNEKLNQWGGAISKASQISGMDPNIIGAQVWAESRGDANTNTTNKDGSADVGLMQISQQRWENDILPNLSDDVKQKITAATGKDPSELDMNNPEDNVIAGSLELRQWYQEKGDIKTALQYYVSGGDPSIDPGYSERVLNFAEILKSGGQLPD